MHDVLDVLNHFYYEFSLNELRSMNDNSLYPNITYNSLLYLDIIYYKENCTVSYLAEVLHISKSAVTVKMNDLIAQGLVTKTQSPADKRVYYLTVSAAVKADYSQYNQKLHHAVTLLRKHYSAKEIDSFCSMLTFIQEHYLE